ncbi:SHOCT domain-containing protein [Nocardioides sp.]|uniref:SHOCT domain-containing protein n=1 Tax=Nocardioides sp. TaxID=35761 RepID=UPI002C86A94F|nr:SHOCT domain-containing protein [Nocardioides sp.]HSX68519.1 SHOCT domain-containing protein [Nocardioides sp.]
MDNNLGFAAGKMVDHGDGLIGYLAPGKFLESFRVQARHVTGVSETRAKRLTYRITVFGQGTTLAEFDGAAGVAPKLDAWFREWNTRVAANEAQAAAYAAPKPAPAAARSAPTAAPAVPNLADQLSALVGLHAAGALTDEEFTAAKTRLLA